MLNFLNYWRWFVITELEIRDKFRYIGFIGWGISYGLKWDKRMKYQYFRCSDKTIISATPTILYDMETHTFESKSLDSIDISKVYGIDRKLGGIFTDVYNSIYSVDGLYINSLDLFIRHYNETITVRYKGKEFNLSEYNSGHVWVSVDGDVSISGYVQASSLYELLNDFTISDDCLEDIYDRELEFHVGIGKVDRVCCDDEDVLIRYLCNYCSNPLLRRSFMFNSGIVKI